MTPRPVRNNNPGDIERNAHTMWQGMMPVSEMTPDQRADSTFVVFENPAYGFRALAILLINYQRIDGLKTVSQMINHFAPPNQNNTAAYVKAVAEFLGVSGDAEIDLSKNDVYLSKMMKKIAIVEAGGWFFSDEDLAAGIKMARG